MNSRYTLLLVGLLVCASLAGCSGTDTAPQPTTASPAPTTPAQTPTATATNTDTPTQAPTTATKTATATVTNTDTETSTQTPTATATVTPEPTPDSPIEGGTARIATVIRVIDGDTLEIRFENGEVDTVRLIGVDTPEPIMSNMDPGEYGIPDTPRGRDWLLNWADRASSFVTEHLAGEHVLVVTDPESDERGSYGRLLAYVYYGDGYETNLGRELLERGLARRYDDASYTLREKYGQLEAEAQVDNRGLWAFDEQPTPTPTATPESTPEDTPTESPSGVVTPTPSNDGDLPDPYDCGDFDNREQVEAVFNPDNDVSGLDSDGDGVACESIP